MELNHLLLLLVVTLCFFFYLICTKKTSKRALPPEISGGWPIIGHLFYFDNDGDDRPSYQAVRDCYTTNDAVFANRPSCLYGEYLGYNNAMLFLSNYGPYWNNIRKLVIQEVLSNTGLEKMRHADKSIMNLTDWLEELSFGLIVKMIAGKDYGDGDGDGDGDEEVERFKEAFRKFLTLSMEFVLWDAFPILLFKWMDFQGHVKLMKRTFKDIDTIFQRWLDEHVKQREMSTEVNERDFIDVMLSKMSDEHQHEGYSRDTVIKATVFGLVLDAADTVALHINWGMALLINNQHVLEKAQVEMDKQVGRDRWIEKSDIKNLVYLQAIIKEYHMKMQRTVLLADIMYLKVLDYTLQRDPKIWSNPDQFDPDRFFNNDIDFRGQRYEFIPFGSGRRSCSGMTYALQVEYLTIGHLIQGFDYRTPSGEPLDMKEGPGMTMRKVNPVQSDNDASPRLALELYKI
ncbi:unnamed protein product [Withania somnifera]